MLRIVTQRASAIARKTLFSRASSTGSQIPMAPDPHSSVKESEEAFNQRFETFFNKANIDHWEIRAAMNELAGMDIVPEPTIICAALRACRKLNDYALAVRFLECIKDKCGDRVSTIYPYVLQEIRPTLDELGINTPEELGYDKPELALQSAYDIH